MVAVSIGCKAGTGVTLFPSLTHSSSKAPRGNRSTSTTTHGYWFKHILLFSSVHKFRIINAEFGGRAYPPLRPSSNFISLNEQIAELPRGRATIDLFHMRVTLVTVRKSSKGKR